MLCVFNNAEKYLEFPPAILSANRFSQESVAAVTVGLLLTALPKLY